MNRFPFLRLAAARPSRVPSRDADVQPELGNGHTTPVHADAIVRFSFLWSPVRVSGKQQLGEIAAASSSRRAASPLDHLV